jgi:hypothetical protein
MDKLKAKCPWTNYPVRTNCRNEMDEEETL